MTGCAVRTGVIRPVRVSTFGSSQRGTCRILWIKQRIYGRVPALFIGGMIPPCLITAAPMCRVAQVSHWPYSSFHRYVKQGGYQQLGEATSNHSTVLTSVNELARTRAYARWLRKEPLIIIVAPNPEPCNRIPLENTKVLDSSA